MEQLIRLQNIDTKLKDLNDLLGDLPSKVEDLNNQEESTKDSITSKKSRSKELDVEISSIFWSSKFIEDEKESSTKTSVKSAP